MYDLEKLKKEIFEAISEYHISDFVYDKIADVIDNFEEDCDCGSDGHNSECFVNN